MRRMMVLVAGLVTFAGCVSTKIVPLEQGRMASLRGKTLTVAKREKPSFGAMTAGKALLGAIGAVAMIAKGNSIVQENNVEDPAGYIAKELAGDLATAHSMTVVQAEGGADILLDVRTVNWSFVYFPTAPHRYRVIYSAKLKLTDTRSGKVLAEGFCARIPEKSDSAPGYEELLADQAARLKQELTAGADQCIGEFRSKVLKSSGVNAASAH
jgi:phosphatidylglycerophosphatase A